MKLGFLSFIAGALFGMGLAVSGMTDPTRVTDFLDLTGRWDPALLFVMGGALASYSFCMYLSRKLLNNKGLDYRELPKCESDPVSRRLLVGTALFGVGWGLAGFCPGPAIANLASLHPEALVFVPTMLAGMVASRVLCETDR